MSHTQTTGINRPSINRLSKWKYGLFIVMFLALLMQAIPSFYGDIPALGIQVKQDKYLSPEAVTRLLDTAAVPAKELQFEAGEMLVTFDTIAHQQQAKALLDTQLAKDADITVQYYSAAPEWFKTLGADPVKLGLDLRGGVQMLLYVDLDAVYQRHTEATAQELKALLRAERIRNVQVRQVSQVELAITGMLAPAEDHLSATLDTKGMQWQVRKSDNDWRLTLTESEQQTIAAAAMEQNIQTLRNRIGELGIVEASVIRQGRDHIRIELPGVHDPKQAKTVIGATASLAFHKADINGRLLMTDTRGNQVSLLKKPVITGEHIVDARSGTDEMGRPLVSIQLDGPGGSKMTDFSRDNVGQAMASVYTEYLLNEQGKLTPSDKIINLATIQSVLPNKFQITGLDSHQEANELALLLRSGALTAPVQIVEERAIGPTLGEQNIQAGISALALGMAGMALFLMVWYRRFGWVAIAGLGANLIMQLGLLVLLPGAVLTLPGIAGLVLTVGMAVDTNVLIFERIRDRLREGASLAVAIDFGYRSAFTTIFDANITTLLSALCLYGIGSGPLQGFATTLILGLISSMVCGIWGTRLLINPIWGRDNRRAIKI
ncbi:protein translocase subunit SecD [Shewanella submarina]|uniref:Protein translocase subunit SecD n=1 Tax=Shewanella submarina TaxID=2016376 RepID=A0ABV7GGL8_9GAMM|nr:protein translocase subunit SecD [Shewanella submarina]MCL1039152.1 protein translocase subunit SecD [Shewanella submarina]